MHNDRPTRDRMIPEAERSNRYKNTINLPETDFPMRGDLPKREPACWRAGRARACYAQIQRARGGPRTRSCCTTARRMRTARSTSAMRSTRCSRTSSVKSKLLAGFDAPYVPGWDCHGLPIEIAVEKKFGKVGDKLDAAAFRAKCREYADAADRPAARAISSGSACSATGTTRIARWISATRPTCCARWRRSSRNGHVVRGVKPVHWCFDCGSALAEAEIEYAGQAVARDRCGLRRGRPQALASTFGVDVARGDDRRGADLDDDAMDAAGKPRGDARARNSNTCWSKGRRATAGGVLLVLAEALAAKRAAALWRRTSVVVHGACAGAEPGRAAPAASVLCDREIPMLLGDHVSAEEGTGAVHTAPGHGVRGLRGRPEIRPGRAVLRRRTQSGRRQRRVPAVDAADGDLRWPAAHLEGQRRDRRVLRDAACCSPTRRSRTAIRIAGATRRRSRSAPRRSGSSRMEQAGLRRDALAAITRRAPGSRNGARRASPAWSKAARTGASRASAPGACRSRCSSTSETSEPHPRTSG